MWVSSENPCALIVIGQAICVIFNSVMYIVTFVSNAFTTLDLKKVGPLVVCREVVLPERNRSVHIPETSGLLRELI